jgi:glutamine amidotransferase
VEVTSSPDKVRNASRLILPGVGAFRDAMANLAELGLIEPFVQKVRSGTPTLGICLGMHLLFTESEEFGLHQGLNLLPVVFGESRRSDMFPTWAGISCRWIKPTHLLAGVDPGSFVYFVHSYYAEPASRELTLASVNHGINFAAIVHRNNIWATQFHPEKSQKVGERLLDNFARL